LKKFCNDNQLTEVYEVNHQLGSGFYGVVKGCKHKSKSSNRAVKFVSLEEETDHLTIVKNEVHVLATIDQHPNITALKEYFVSDSQYALVFELYTGGELFDKLIDLGKFKEPDAKKVIDQVLQAVNYLHQQSITHRDIKLENILLSSKDPADAKVILADMGNASIIWTDDDGNSLPLTDPLPGSLIYAAPESLKDDSAGYGKEVDIWSVGVITYILIAGFPPFNADDDEQLKPKIIKGPVQFPSPEWGDPKGLSESSRTFCLRLMTYDPGARASAPQALQQTWLRG